MNDRKPTKYAAFLTPRPTQRGGPLTDIVRFTNLLTFLPASTFQPIAMETLGSICESACHVREDRGRRITAISNEE